MKNSFHLFRSRSDVYRALQLFFITTSTLIAITFAFPGLLYIPWLYPLMVLWAFILMAISFYNGQTALEEEKDYAVEAQAGNETEEAPLLEQFRLRSVLPQKREWEEDDLV